MSTLTFGDTQALLIDASGFPDALEGVQCALTVAHHSPFPVDWREGRYHLALPPPDEFEFLENYARVASTGIWGNHTLLKKIIEHDLVPESFRKSKGVLFLGTLFSAVESITLIKEGGSSSFEEKYGLYVSLLWWYIAETDSEFDEDGWQTSLISLHNAFNLLRDGGRYDVLVLLPESQAHERQGSLFADGLA